MIEDLANALCDVLGRVSLRHEPINHLAMLRPQSFISGASGYFHRYADASPL